MSLETQSTALNEMVAECHGRAVAAGWYSDLETGEPIKRNVAEQLCLIHSEISEGLEGYRKGLQDQHLPERRSIEVELVDAIIRICDLAGALKLDLGTSYALKLEYNRRRADHSIEARRAEGGKRI